MSYPNEGTLLQFVYCVCRESEICICLDQIISLDAALHNTLADNPELLARAFEKCGIRPPNDKVAEETVVATCVGYGSVRICNTPGGEEPWGLWNDEIGDVEQFLVVPIEHLQAQHAQKSVHQKNMLL